MEKLRVFIIGFIARVYVMLASQGQKASDYVNRTVNNYCAIDYATKGGYNNKTVGTIAEILVEDDDDTVDDKAPENFVNLITLIAKVVDSGVVNVIDYKRAAEKLNAKLNDIIRLAEKASESYDPFKDALELFKEDKVSYKVTKYVSKEDVRTAHKMRDVRNKVIEKKILDGEFDIPDEDHIAIKKLYRDFEQCVAKAWNADKGVLDLGYLKSSAEYHDLSYQISVALTYSVMRKVIDVSDDDVVRQLRGMLYRDKVYLDNDIIKTVVSGGTKSSVTISDAFDLVQDAQLTLWDGIKQLAEYDGNLLTENFLEKKFKRTVLNLRVHIKEFDPNKAVKEEETSLIQECFRTIRRSIDAKGGIKSASMKYTYIDIDAAECDGLISSCEFNDGGSLAALAKTSGRIGYIRLPAYSAEVFTSPAAFRESQATASNADVLRIVELKKAMGLDDTLDELVNLKMAGFGYKKLAQYFHLSVSTIRLRIDELQKAAKSINLTPALFKAKDTLTGFGYPDKVADNIIGQLVDAGLKDEVILKRVWDCQDAIAYSVAHTYKHTEDIAREKSSSIVDWLNKAGRSRREIVKYIFRNRDMFLFEDTVDEVVEIILGDDNPTKKYDNAVKKAVDKMIGNTDTTKAEHKQAIAECNAMVSELLRNVGFNDAEVAQRLEQYKGVIEDNCMDKNHLSDYILNDVVTNLYN